MRSDRAMPAIWDASSAVLSSVRSFSPAQSSEQAELLRHSHRVVDTPTLNRLTILEPEHSDGQHVDRPARRRHPPQLTRVRADRATVRNREVAFGDDEIERVAEVRK